MGQKIKKLKKIRLHREGTDQLVTGAIALVAIAAILWTTLDNKIPFWAFVVVFGTVYGIVLNFYRCPIRYLNVEDTSKLVVAPADGKIVVIEEVENAPYFGDRRLMISIFMSLWNVHANWFPVDGKVKFVKHVDGNYHKAWLPKASEENEHADVMITTPEGVDVLCRQIAGAVLAYLMVLLSRGSLENSASRSSGVYLMALVRFILAPSGKRSGIALQSAFALSNGNFSTRATSLMEFFVAMEP